MQVKFHASGLLRYVYILSAHRKRNDGAMCVTSSCIGAAELVGSTFKVNYSGVSGGPMVAQQCPMRVQGFSFGETMATSVYGMARL